MDRFGMLVLQRHLRPSCLGRSAAVVLLSSCGEQRLGCSFDMAGESPCVLVVIALLYTYWFRLGMPLAILARLPAMSVFRVLHV
jgi:hypothetical protein